MLLSFFSFFFFFVYFNFRLLSHSIDVCQHYTSFHRSQLPPLSDMVICKYLLSPQIKHLYRNFLLYADKDLKKKRKYKKRKKNRTGFIKTAVM